MKNKMKFVVAAGAVVGVVGMFLPLATAKVGSGGGALSLGLSLWAAKAFPGIGMFTWGFLGAFAVVALLAGIGISKRFGRGLAVGTLISALAPTGISALWLSEALSRGAAGSGLLLLVAGGSLVMLSSIFVLIKPEARVEAKAAAAAA